MLPGYCKPRERCSGRNQDDGTRGGSKLVTSSVNTAVAASVEAGLSGSEISIERKNQWQ
jgi:hypothetical protein